MLQVAIGREAADLVFLEVNRHKAHFFVSVRKDCTIHDVKQMLLNVVESRSSHLELYRQYPMNGEKYTKLNDSNALTTCGFQPDTATPDRPAALVLTIGDEEPETAAMSRPPQLPEQMEFMGYVARSNKRRNVATTQNEIQVSYASYCICHRPNGLCRCEPPKKMGMYTGSSFQSPSAFN